MNRMISTLFIMAVLSINIINCNPMSGGRNQIAITPIPTNDCISGGYGYNGNCNFNYSQYPGFYNYPNTYDGYYQGYENQFQDGFCYCPSGAQPIYNSSWGMGCIQNQYIDPNTYQYQNYQWDHTRRNWSPYSYNANNFSNSSSRNGCYSSTYYSCDVRVANSCGSNSYCKPIGGGGITGVCIFNYPHQ